MDQAASAVAATPLVAMRGVVKTFGSLVANDSIDIDIAPGEVHALLGENGAGKSTLVKMLYGLLQPDVGAHPVAGRADRAARPARPRGARGIGMVFQHFSLFDAMTVAENVALALDGDEPASELADRLARGLPRLWPAAGARPRGVEPVGRRAPAHRDRALPDAEPAAADPRRADLGADAAGSEGLFATLERVRAEGRAVLYISHKLEEVRAHLRARDDPAPRQGRRALRPAAGKRRERWRA